MAEFSASLRLLYAFKKLCENLGTELGKPWDKQDQRLIESYEVSIQELRHELERRLKEGERDV